MTTRTLGNLLACLGTLVLATPPVAASAQDVPPPAIAPGNPAHERFLMIDGVRNFRDVGGYSTTDGRTVRWGALYRSGSLGSLRPDGMVQLERLRIAAIIDLRTTEERGRDLTNWLPMSGLGYWSRGYGYSRGDLAGAFGDPATVTAQTVRDMMMGAYRRLAKEQAPAYRELFARLAQPGTGAVVVNCTAGKDRTGVATALVLTAIGVPYETVREDFLLSNGARGMDTLQAALSGPIAALPPDVAQPLVGVEPAYLDATFDQLAKDYGGIAGYLQQELGVGPAQIAAIRRRLLD